eukprot:223414-Pelagomonas_calceolata.AAC.5
MSGVQLVECMWGHASPHPCIMGKQAIAWRTLYTSDKAMLCWKKASCAGTSTVCPRNQKQTLANRKGPNELLRCA